MYLRRYHCISTGLCVQKFQNYMEKFVCNHCKKGFSSAVNLKTHEKTAKYCLKLREVTVAPNLKFGCDDCGKSFTQKWYMEKHECKNKQINEKEKQLQSLIDENSFLKSQITDLEGKLSKEKCKRMVLQSESEYFKNIVLNTNKDYGKSKSAYY